MLADSFHDFWFDYVKLFDINIFSKTLKIPAVFYLLFHLDLSKYISENSLVFWAYQNIYLNKLSTVIENYLKIFEILFLLETVKNEIIV